MNKFKLVKDYCTFCDGHTLCAVLDESMGFCVCKTCINQMGKDITEKRKPKKDK